MYEKMYHILFQAVTEAMELLEAREYQEALTGTRRKSICQNKNQGP